MENKFEDVREQFEDWLFSSSALEVFKEIYPQYKVHEERLDSGRVVYKTPTPFPIEIPHSKLPTIYYEGFRFCDLATGKAGSTPEFIFNVRPNGPFHNLSLEKQIEIFERKAGLGINERIMKNFDDWEDFVLDYDCSSIGHLFEIDKELVDFAEHSVNDNYCYGESISNETGKHETPVDYYYRNFDYFDKGGQKEILRYMPSIRNKILGSEQYKDFKQDNDEGEKGSDSELPF